MGVFSLRRSLRYALLSSLLVGSSAHAGTVTACWSGSDYCGVTRPSLASGSIEAAPGQIEIYPGASVSVGGGGPLSLLNPRAPIEWERFEIGSGGTISFSQPRTGEPQLRIGVSEWSDKSRHGWTAADATHFVHDWTRRHDRDFEEFRRHWDRSHDGHHDHHGHNGGCDDDLPKPVPLPGAALLFGPALLMLRAFQRRNA